MCPDPELLTDHVLGRLSRNMRDELTSHLATCSGCRAAVLNLARGVWTQRSTGARPTLGAEQTGSSMEEEALVADRYAFEDVIGMGGMGVVYAARDIRLGRKIALKLIHTPAGRSEVQVALEEARAMARIAHPNVVQVYDAGLLGAQPYLAMELVEGEPLSSWLKREARSTREILDAFWHAGQGLLAIHQAGFVHRDFKPENVLVSRSGRVCVSDFGLAQAASTLNAGAAFTAGTPAYMAPEQRDGSALDERSDQYSFCVALYEALAGVHPQKVAGAPFPPPSLARRVPARVWRLLHRGMAARPQERFGSLAPVLAGIAPRVRSGRWVLAASGALALAAIVAVAFPAWQRWRVEQRCAREASALAPVWNDAARGRLTPASFTPAASNAALANLQRMLDGYAEGWRRNVRAVCEGAWLHRQLSPQQWSARQACFTGRLEDLRAAVTALTGPTQADVSKAFAAVEQLRPLERCANLDQARVPAGPPTEALASLEAEFAGLRMDSIFGRYATAAAGFDVLAQKAKRFNFPSLEAESRLEQARAVHLAGDPQKALELLTVASQVSDAAGVDTARADALVQRVYVLARERGRFEEALQVAQDARAVVQRLGGDARYSLVLDSHVATVYLQQGRAADGMALLRQVLKAEEALYGPSDPRVARTLIPLGNAHAMLDQKAEGLALFERAEAIFRASYGEDHPMVAVAVGSQGIALWMMERHAEAAAALQKALALQEARLGPDHPDLAVTLHNLANVLSNLGENARAAAYLERALALNITARGADHPSIAAAHQSLGDLYLDLGDLKAATAQFEAAWRILETREDRVEQIRTLSTLGLAAARGGDERASRRHHQQAIALAASLPASHSMRAVAWSYSGESLSTLGKTRAAIQALRTSLALREQQLEPKPADRAEVQLLLASALFRTPGGTAEARRLATLALEALEQSEGVAAQAAAQKARELLRPR